MLNSFISKKQLLMVFVDLVMIIGSMFLSSVIRIGFHNGVVYVETNVISFCVIGGLYIFIFYMSGLYDFRKDFRSPYDLLTMACVSIAAFIIVAFVFYVNWSLRLGRGIFLINGILITSFLISWRYSYSHLISRPGFQANSIIIGAGKAGEEVLDAIKNSKGCGLNIIGFVDDEKGKKGSFIGDVSVLGDRNDLLQIIETYNITQIIVAITHKKHTELIRMLIKCSQDGVNITDMPILYEGLTGKVPLKHIDDLWLLNSLVRQSKFHVHRIKRSMDFILSLFILLIFSPLLPIIAILIKKGSKGSVFYTQERVSKKGKVFKIFKFRSMIENAEENTGVVCASDHDSRITGIGKFLRKWRLDEIPQLINVIKGDMSLVGPRPEREFFIKKYDAEIPFYSQRLSVQPGLTGWAQVKFLYASSTEETEEKLQYDLYYIKNLSFVLDVIILLQTIKVILFGKGK